MAIFNSFLYVYQRVLQFSQIKQVSLKSHGCFFCSVWNSHPGGLHFEANSKQSDCWWCTIYGTYCTHVQDCLCIYIYIISYILYIIHIHNMIYIYISLSSTVRVRTLLSLLTAWRQLKTGLVDCSDLHGKPMGFYMFLPWRSCGFPVSFFQPIQWNFEMTWDVIDKCCCFFCSFLWVTYHARVLVGGFKHGWIVFNDIWDVILPIDELHHFSRWLGIPPTRSIINHH